MATTTVSAGCEEFNEGPIVKFTGGFDRRFSSPVASSPMTSSNKVLECKTNCINDPLCSVWSLNGSTCNKYRVDQRDTNSFNGLVINPNYGYNSGQPRTVIPSGGDPRTRFTDRQTCEDRCKSNPECGFYSISLTGGRLSDTGICTLQKVTASDGFPTGFAKICSGYACVLGQEYITEDKRNVIRFSYTTTPITVQIKFGDRMCFESAQCTVTSDTTLTFTIRGTAYTVTTPKTNSDSIQVAGVAYFKNKTGTPFEFPTKACCTNPSIRDCVKGGEYINIETGRTIKFHATNNTLTLFYPGGPCVIDRPYVPDDAARTIISEFVDQYSNSIKTTIVIDSITSDSFNFNIRIIVINTGLELGNLTGLNFVKKSSDSWQTLTCIPNVGVSDQGNSAPQITVGAKTFQGTPDPDPDPESGRDQVTISFESDGNSTLFFSTPSKGCQRYRYIFLGDSIEFTVSETITATVPVTTLIKKYKLFNFDWNVNPKTVQIKHVTDTFDQYKTTKLSTNETSATTLSEITTPFDPSTCRDIPCPNSDDIKYCEDESTPNEYDRCSDGTYASCVGMCSQPNDICPSPFTRTMKFMNEDDYSDRVTIYYDAQATGPQLISFKDDAIKFPYFVSSIPGSSSDKIIFTPVSTFIYRTYETDTGNRIHILTSFDDSHLIYKDIRSYFYKKTIIAPLINSAVVNRTEESINCNTGSTTSKTIPDTVSYHCIFFYSYSQFLHTIVKKSTVNTFHDDNTVNFISFEHVTNNSLEQIETRGIWGVNTNDETLFINPLTVPLRNRRIYLENGNFEDITYYNIELPSQLDQNYMTTYRGNHLYTKKNFVCEFPNSTELRDINRAGFNGDNLIIIRFQEDIEEPRMKTVQFMRKDTGQKNLIKYIASLNNNSTIVCRVVDIYDTEFTKSQIQSGFYFFDNLITDRKTCIRISDMVLTSIDVNEVFSGFSLPNSITPIDRETGEAGNFFKYDCQLLSGIEGYNRCATKITGNFSSPSESCSDIFDAALKCDMRENAIGFEYDTSNNTIKMIDVTNIRTLTTNRNEIVTSSRGDLFDLHYELKTEILNYNYGGQLVLVDQFKLFHNIFPSEKISPITDGSQPNNQYVNQSAVGSFKSPFINLVGNTDLQFNNTTTNTKIVYLKSNYPNVFGGGVFVGVHHKKLLPSSYSGNAGLRSVPTTITVNSITVDGTLYSNQQLKVYRGSQGTDNDVFSVTINDKFIKRDLTSVYNLTSDCYWNIVLFQNYDTKLFLVSGDVVLELDLSANFVFPSTLSTIQHSLQLDVNNNTCIYTLDNETFNCKYYYTGNDILVYDDSQCKEDGTKDTRLIRRFKFYDISCELYDIVSKNIVSPQQTSARGSFLVKTNVFTLDRPVVQNYNNGSDAWRPITLLQQNPILGIINLAVIGGQLPPAAMGNMNAKENGIWFGLFIAQFIPVAGPAARLGRLFSALRFARIQRVVPRRIPDTPIGSDPGPGPVGPDGTPPPPQPTGQGLNRATDALKLPEELSNAIKDPKGTVQAGTTPANKPAGIPPRPPAPPSGVAPSTDDAIQAARNANSASSTLSSVKGGGTATGGEYGVQYGRLYNKGLATDSPLQRTALNSKPPVPGSVDTSSNPTARELIRKQRAVNSLPPATPL